MAAVIGNGFFETLKFYLREELFFLSGNHETATKSLKIGILEECPLNYYWFLQCHGCEDDIISAQQNRVCNLSRNQKLSGLKETRVHNHRPLRWARADRGNHQSCVLVLVFHNTAHTQYSWWSIQDVSFTLQTYTHAHTQTHTSTAVQASEPSFILHAHAHAHAHTHTQIKLLNPEA